MSAQPALSIETITPELAQRYLERNVCNRKISRSSVRRFAADMKRGEWRLNGESIKFDTEGRLIDGQHRLFAIVEAGVAIELAVARGLEHRTFETIDTGRNRTGGDILSIYGFKFPNETAAAARLLALYLNSDRWSSLKSMRLSHTQLVELIDKHEDLPERAYEAMTKPMYNTLTPHSHRCFCYYAASRLNPKCAEQFFSELGSGRFSRNSDAIHALRERLIMVAQEVVPPPASVKLAWMITAWNHWYRGHRLGRLSRTPGGIPRFAPDPFPLGRRRAKRA